MISPHGTIIPRENCPIKFPDHVNVTNEIIDSKENRWALDEGRWLTFNGTLCVKTKTPVQWVLYFNELVYTHCEPIDDFIVQWFIWKDGRPDILGCYRMWDGVEDKPTDHYDHCLAHSYLKQLVQSTEFRLHGMHGEM